MIFSNIKTTRSQILFDTKGRAKIYIFIFLETGKIYIGSAFYLSKQLKDYYFPYYLK